MSARRSEEELVGAAEAQEMLGISTATYYRWLRDGRLNGTKVGGRWRFERSQIEELLKPVDSGAEDVAIGKAIEHLGGRLRQLGLASAALATMTRAEPVDTLAQMLLEHAIARDATDVDVAAGAAGVEVRERIDGELSPLQPDLPAGCLRGLVDAFRRLSAGVTARDLSRDGIFSTEVAGRRIDVRVSTYPTTRGESMTLRLLDPRRSHLDLAKLGLGDDVVTALREVLGKPNGVLLLNGATGSGKSTTLYALLEAKRAPTLKVMTAESPVELHLDGVQQAEVDEDFSFEDAMRAMLRNYLDVGMVSELRTPEAIDLLFKMARTGHFMMSSLHARDSLGALLTILQIGQVGPSIVAGSLLGVLTQTLVPKLCRECARSREMTAQEARQLSLPPAKVEVHAASGCDHCRQSGHRGRTTAVEWLPMTPGLAAALTGGASTREALAAGRGEHYRDLRADILDKMYQGVISPATARNALA